MSVQTAIPAGFSSQRDDSPLPAKATLTLAVDNMHCGGCLNAVEKALGGVGGVSHARANLSAKRVTVQYAPAVTGAEALIEELGKAGFRSAVMDRAESADESGRDAYFLKRVAIAGFAAANIMLLSVSVWAGTASDMDDATRALFHRISALIALPAIAYSGHPFFVSALEALRGRRLNMDVPISLAIILSTGMSFFQMLKGSEQVYFDAGITLLFFLLIGRWLDQRLRTRARGEAQNLLSLQGGLATVIGEGGVHRTVPSHALVPGDRVLVAPGERVPADGTVITGSGDIDQSLITGESEPVTVTTGYQLHAGTLNLSNAITLKVTAADDMTLLAEIGRLMADAEQGRAKYRRLADRAASLYAPAVHLLGLATFLVWMALGAGWEFALTTAIAVLIITCPCALALAVPAVQIAAANRLFRQGIIPKSPDGLERLAEVDTVIFDKTGTLTLGRPVLRDADKIDTAVLQAAASLAASSNHPLAKAVVAAAKERNCDVVVADDVEEVPGRGLKRSTQAGEERLGSARWCGAGRKGKAASLWYRPPDGSLTAFRFEDRLRPDAADVVEELKKSGMQVGVLSGDRESAVENAAGAAGIGDWIAHALPSEKIENLKARALSGQHILMVGDGLNDAPAQAQAHVSISPASAADITQRAADLVFQGDRLAPVCEALVVARRARFMAFQNFALALAYNAVCVPFAMAGFVTPLVAAIAMSTSSVLVTLNALRLAPADPKRGLS